jgi:hypothetical protein
MSRCRRTTGGALGVLVVMMVLRASASTEPRVPDVHWTAAQQKVAADVARGRARAALWQQVRSLPLTSGRTLGDVLAAEENLSREFRLWIRSRPATGTPRYFRDGVCEVNVGLTPEELGDFLSRALQEQRLSGDILTPGVLRAAQRRWTPLWGLGAADVATLSDGPQPPGWENVSADGVLYTRRAAEQDALAALLEELGRLTLDGRRTVADFYAADAGVRPALMIALRGAVQMRVEFGGDQLAVAEASVGMRDVLAALQSVVAGLTDPGDFSPADFRGMVMRAGRDTLAAVGFAAPAADEIRPPGRALREFNAPDWAKGTLRATGTYSPPDGARPPLAVRVTAARLLAIDALRAKVHALFIQDGVTVAQFLAYHQAVKPDVVMMLSGAQVTSTPRERADGSVEVEVARPARRLWELLRRYMRLEEVPIDDEGRPTP